MDNGHSNGTDLTTCFKSIEYPSLESLIIHDCPLTAETLKLIAKSCPNLTNVVIVGKWKNEAIENYAYLKNIFPNLSNFERHGYNSLKTDHGGDFTLFYDYDYSIAYDFGYATNYEHGEHSEHGDHSEHSELSEHGEHSELSEHSEHGEHTDFYHSSSNSSMFSVDSEIVRMVSFD